ncbi:trichohyalin isoform X2 [Odontomachus brunneus]|uniref:trichohyalin isoform X2 n=1 Tax=Odontomachus brunneus TaxID=486640 RepID=UPI0013F1C3B4|nr:trichohyalin isoform X2 [Odontomachus brunneus]
MIGVRRITKMDMLTEAVAKPKIAVLKFGLPKWKAMSLEHKIPMIPNAPKDTYNLTRSKLGKKLWAVGPKAEFDLSDPYCRETNFAYEPLHDEHLLGFFSKPANIKYLLNTDLITEDLHVKCTLRDYNAYRGYLRKTHVNGIRRELRRRNRLLVEQRALRRADDQARKEAKRLEKKIKLTDVKQLIAQQREARLRMQKERDRNVAQRLKLSKFIKQEGWKLINAKREERYERIQQKCKLARREMIEVSMERKRKERARARVREKRLVDAERQKRKDTEERWKRKRDFQERNIAEQEVLLQCLNTRRQVFITNYNDKIKKERARMERLLENTKLFTNCYIRRYLPDGRRRICCEKYLQTDTDRKGDEKKRESWRSTYRSRELVKSKEAKVVKVKFGQDLRRKGKSVHTELGRKHTVRKDDYNRVKKHRKIGKLMIQERRIKVSQRSVTLPKVEPTKAAAFGKQTTLTLKNTRQCRCRFAKPTNSVSTNTTDSKNI